MYVPCRKTMTTTTTTVDHRHRPLCDFCTLISLVFFIPFFFFSLRPGQLLCLPNCKTKGAIVFVTIMKTRQRERARLAMKVVSHLLGKLALFFPLSLSLTCHLFFDNFNEVLVGWQREKVEWDSPGRSLVCCDMPTKKMLSTSLPLLEIVFFYYFSHFCG